VSFDRAPYISVITPTFNRARLLPRAIESVLVQSFDDLEYIIVDDGSTDNTHKEIRELIESDSRIHYHRSENKGTAMARDLGCSIAKGSYITFLDSDDEYLPNHLESRVAIISAQPAIELLHGGVEIIGDPFVADKDDPSRKIHLDDCIIGGTFVIRRDLWKRIGGFGTVIYGDDTDFFHRAEQAGALIVQTDIPSYRYYRTEEDSLCTIAMREGLEGIANYRKGNAYRD
jgi:glycosyltransferase involved in cell wall biosynthesis